MNAFLINARIFVLLPECVCVCHCICVLCCACREIRELQCVSRCMPSSSCKGAACMHTQVILQANYWECLPCVLWKVPMPVCGKYMGMQDKWMAKCAALFLRAECHRGALKSSGRKCHINTNSPQRGALGPNEKYNQRQMCSKREEPSITQY